MADYRVRNTDWIRGGISRQFDARTWGLDESGGRYYVRDRNGELLGMLIRGDVPFTSPEGKTEDGEIARKAEPKKFAKALKSLKENGYESLFPVSWVEIRLLSFSEQDEVKAKLPKRLD